MAEVTGLAVTPVKGTRLHTVDQIELGPEGAVGNRRFFVVDERRRLISGKRTGKLQQVIADCRDGSLRVAFPGGPTIEGPIELGAPITARFFSGSREGRTVGGPFAAALSDHLGQAVELIDAGSAVDRGHRGAVSLVSRGSLWRMAEQAGTDAIDVRRFRMLIEVDGIAPHEEDGWVGRRVRLGDAEVRFNGHVGRCLITSRDPDSGDVDLPTLEILGGYRRELDTTEPLPFGIYGEVRSGGPLRVGDPVALVQ